MSGGGIIRWEPNKTIALEAGELVFPHAMQLGACGEFARGEEVHDVAGARFGRPKVKGVFAAVGKVAIAVAPCVGQGDGTKATKTKKVANVGRGLGE